MFGLMKTSAHEAEMQRIRDALGYTAYRYSNPIEMARNVKNERDEAKTRETTAKAEIVTLKARIAELEKPVAIKKSRPVGKASEPTPTIVKVAMKGKVKS